jgi:two-component system, OmpR family, alkaline phosphatase synthesis response regulator PhoP
VSAARRKLVLVVDDDEDVLQLASVALRRAGHEVLTAGDGRTGLALARECRPALAVLDIRMPKLGGIAVLRTLRNDPATSAIRVVLLSASVDERTRVAGFAEGADAYVAKPFSPRDLVERVAALLGDG